MDYLNQFWGEQFLLFPFNDSRRCALEAARARQG